MVLGRSERIRVSFYFLLQVSVPRICRRLLKWYVLSPAYVDLVFWGSLSHDAHVLHIGLAGSKVRRGGICSFKQYHMPLLYISHAFKHVGVLTIVDIDSERYPPAPPCLFVSVCKKRNTPTDLPPGYPDHRWPFVRPRLVDSKCTTQATGRWYLAPFP